MDFKYLAVTQSGRISDTQCTVTLSNYIVSIDLVVADNFVNHNKANYEFSVTEAEEGLILTEYQFNEKYGSHHYTLADSIIDPKVTISIDSKDKIPELNYTDHYEIAVA